MENILGPLLALTADNLLTTMRLSRLLASAVFTTTALKDSSERPYSVAGRMYQSGSSEDIYPDLVARTSNHRNPHSLIVAV